MSPLTETRELKETVQIGTFTFHDTQLTEWDLKDKAFDVILGQPWFKKHNPVIDWRTCRLTRTWMSMRRLLNHQDGS
ncbi:hypothetical protein DYB31_014123 [Aphanomyces astaci]|uniref:Uncharacterized protein n=1 Tax=Aphanomyces astaci TaxID=112090 RepID=A0A397EUL7_APHAT|nr:hypothetical protein DYB31_014123 [Aphanomyces astaci]